MTLLDDNRDQVDFYPEKETTDELGNPGIRVPDWDAEPVETGGRLQPGTAIEVSADGQQVLTQRVFRTRDTLVGAFAGAKHNGRKWDVVGEPIFHNGSDMTRHYTVTLQAWTAKPIGTGGG